MNQINQRINQNRIQLFTTNKDQARKIQDEFSVMETGAENNITVRSGQWDGKHRFYTLKSGKEGFLFEIPIGFKGRVEDFTGQKFPNEVDYTPVLKFLKGFKKTLPFEPYRHQLKMLLGLLSSSTHLGVAATGSGKSLVIYGIVKYYRNLDKKILILVPTVSLVTQLFDDFKDYNATDEFMSQIQLMGGDFTNKEIQKPVVISTWQSAYKADLSNFQVVVNDEVHTAKADILLKILNNPFEIKLGLTGTPPIEKLEYMKLEQNFGQPKKYINAKGLIDLGLATDLAVVSIFLCQKQKIMKYQDEVRFIKENIKRSEWVTKFLRKLKGPTIALYNHTDHGKKTWENLTGVKMTSKIQNDFQTQKDLGVFFMTGSVKPKVRNQILDYFRTLENESVVMIGQSKILSTGINLKPLKNLVFLTGTKSYTQVIQSIGRVMRLHDAKSKAVVFDLVDDFTNGRKTENYALTHFYQRLGFYEYQQFNVIEKEIKL